MTVRNNIPKDWPTVSEGISIHWHGFSMRGDDSGMWYDGVAYLTMCPIVSGQTFVYRFTVIHRICPLFFHPLVAKLLYCMVGRLSMCLICLSCVCVCVCVCV